MPLILKAETHNNIRQKSTWGEYLKSVMQGISSAYKEPLQVSDIYVALSGAGTDPST